ncbi:DUF5999 family protein [Streptomyces sp. TE33382]
MTSSTTTCQHNPLCPPADASDHGEARVVCRHPEQGWCLLCNGVLQFDDRGELLPDGSAVPAHARDLYSQPGFVNWSHLPSVARVVDHLTGGSDNYQADRDLAAALLEAAPWLPHELAVNRRHGTRAVRAIASRYGIRRFLDLGCGLPFSRKGARYDDQTPRHTYDAAASVHGDACVVYVDNDPMVAGHARMVLAEQHPFTAAVEADVREFDGLVATPEVQALLAPGRPVAVLAHDLLSWVSDRAAGDLVTRLATVLPAGSVLSVTHAGLDLAPEAMEALADRYAAAGIDFVPRSRQDIQSLMAPWELEFPGLVPTGQWHPAPHIPGPTGKGFSYAAIAFRPEVS